MESLLIKKAREYAEHIFKQKVFITHTYHNLEHTKDVVAGVEIIGKKSGLTEDELESALVAAWFHDTGYICGDQQHEQSAVNNANTLLHEWKIPPLKIKSITEAILSTCMPQQPTFMLSKVLCDADLLHLSSEDFLIKNENLRKEWRIVKGIVMDDQEWIQRSLRFLKAHRYHTPYGQTVLEAAKKENIMLLEKLLIEMN